MLSIRCLPDIGHFCSASRFSLRHTRVWRHQMEAFPALLALYVGNSPVTGEFLSQRPVTRSFDVFFDLRLSKRLGKQSQRRWFGTPLPSLWRHCNPVYWLDIRVWYSQWRGSYCFRSHGWWSRGHRRSPGGRTRGMHGFRWRPHRWAEVWNIHSMKTSWHGDVFRTNFTFVREYTDHRWTPPPPPPPPPPPTRGQ